MSKVRLIITSIISIVLVSILLLGSTYSIFTSEEISEDANVYTTGNLNITYKLDSSNVKITDVTPMTEEEADSVKPYRITVTNNGNVPYKFNVILSDTTASNVIDYDYIMTKVGYLEPESLADCTNNIIKEDVILPAGESVDIDVRVWISDTIKNTEMNKSFFAKLKVDGIAIYDKNEEIDNSILSLTYMKVLFSKEVEPGYFRSNDYREKIKNVLFVDYIDTTNKVISWDLSVEGEEGKVIAWLLDSTTSGYYDLYIGAEEVIFPRNLYSFLSTMKMVDSISFDNLDTSLVTDMGGMF